MRLGRSYRTAPGDSPRHTGTRIDRIGVVVPVHNEEQGLPRCLGALQVAASRVSVAVRLIVVLDTCTDNSAAVVGDFAHGNVEAITVNDMSVGCARAAGMTTHLQRHGVPGTWLATTDGDSSVPPHWLAAQLRHANSGARVVAGTVTVQDWGDHSEAVRDRAQRDYRTAPHRHVHGANLSFSATAYIAAGGFNAVPCHEDVQLVDAFIANAEPIAWALDMPVVTSSRRTARAPQGFAGYLASLETSLQSRVESCSETHANRAM